ncbi:putative ATPase or kinase [Candidatus Kinetoplastibacterium desouzaii TCC079E]|uniref:tRNA threonylcarbamoyladenosine biosynthesis protein TsaE n=1 Tax=Candidatus Kinetoplastidibacterium desouzai TCC079E TaxID=1208919 RepID=M1L2X3_9PROT|nr:tRNA (adenosine(37)-N6)-threonylcarbamoyltransferase complex ATPase subunit type 1 TsaE [Candidatus Kinetoplastibacterium desouzaii]AGF47103.1 putative ATPase or kinase [Candidatus Kinetoplastibacterium desouzaii TCC079E]
MNIIISSNSIYLPDVNRTNDLAKILFSSIFSKSEPSTLHINLKGDIGTGKTTFARSFLQNMGIKDRIKSPSYSLLESYKALNLNIYHFDFYRIDDPIEFINLGFKDILKEKALFFIEWPEKVEKYLPIPDLELSFQCYKTGRIVEILAKTNQGTRWSQTILGQKQNL